MVHNFLASQTCKKSEVLLLNLSNLFEQVVKRTCAIRPIVSLHIGYKLYVYVRDNCKMRSASKKLNLNSNPKSFINFKSFQSDFTLLYHFL